MKEHKNEKGEKRKNDGEKRGNKQKTYVYSICLYFIA